MGGTLNNSEWHLVPFLAFILHFSPGKRPLCIDCTPSNLIQEKGNLSLCLVKVITDVVIYLFDYTTRESGKLTLDDCFASKASDKPSSLEVLYITISLTLSTLEEGTNIVQSCIPIGGRVNAGLDGLN
jgi:hypothetical protein